jgi:hypothetical protein
MASVERVRLPTQHWRWQLRRDAECEQVPVAHPPRGKVSVKYFLQKLCQEAGWTTSYVQATSWILAPRAWSVYVFPLASLLRAVERYLLRETPVVDIVDYVYPNMIIKL